VIVNELGEIALDHDLIETSDESFVRLTNGCLCCKVRSDLTLTLADLAARRAAGTVPLFERVVIETTGLADPAPILHALMTADDVNEIYVLDGIITTVDALTGLNSLDRYPESLRQAAVADTLLVTKTDVSDAQTSALAQRLAVINPGTPVRAVVRGEIAPSALFDSGVHSMAPKHEQVQRWLAEEALAAGNGDTHRRHRAGISSFCIVREEPVHAATLPLFLAALAENCGGELLRMKGIVHVAEEPLRPVVIHGVQHVYHAPVWLTKWPSEDRRTRMVFIGHDIPESWMRALLELLEMEVKEELRARAMRA
jgi:G3E family GTPase